VRRSAASSGKWSDNPGIVALSGTGVRRGDAEKGGDWFRKWPRVLKKSSVTTFRRKNPGLVDVVVSRATPWPRRKGSDLVYCHQAVSQATRVSRAHDQGLVLNQLSGEAQLLDGLEIGPSPFRPCEAVFPTPA
jgi:hypothetical protein